MINHITRIRSKVIIIDKNGELWLTRRKKLKRDSRRRLSHITKKQSVIFIPIKKL